VVLGGGRDLYSVGVVAVVDRPQDIENEAPMRFFGGEEGDAA